jgi:hypothetical protein
MAKSYGMAPGTSWSTGIEQVGSTRPPLAASSNVFEPRNSGHSAVLTHGRSPTTQP